MKNTDKITLTVGQLKRLIKESNEYSDFEIKDVYYSDIEVLKKDNGMPFVKIKKYSGREQAEAFCRQNRWRSVFVG